MTADPVVSVIVPTRNYGRYLSAAIESVRAQTLESWECLIVDDGSTDETQAVLARLAATDERIKTYLEAQRGVAAARNHALRLCRGRYVQFLDADDLLHPAKLASQVDVLGSCAEVDIVYGPTRYFDDGDGRRLLRSSMGGPDVAEPAPVSGAGTVVLDRLLVGNLMTIEAPLFRKSVFDDVGLFNEQLDRMEDWDLWLRCALAGKRFLFVPSADPGAMIRVHSASLSYREALMATAEVGIRKRVQKSLPTLVSRDVNKRHLDAASAYAGMLLGLDGDALGGLRYLLPAALSQRRPVWFAWSLGVLLTPIPGVRHLLSKVRKRRHRRVAQSS